MSNFSRGFVLILRCDGTGSNMSIAADAIRPFWISGLNDITGNVTKDMAAWFCDREYQVYDSLRPNSFILSVAREDPLLSAFAFDCNRMAVAAFESIAAVHRISSFPKSIAWLVIKSYYAAFFSAHAILRMLGISYSKIDSPQASSVYMIADLFGKTNDQSVSKGYYECAYHSADKKLICAKIGGSGGGAHESFWTSFFQRMRKLSNDILSIDGFATSSQQVSAKLSELCENLSFAHCNNGSWLSFIRNGVNYRHHFGAWYPYRDYKSYYDRLYDNCTSWKSDPMAINLRLAQGRTIERFQATCSFIIGLCSVLVSDMAKRCSLGKSFHRYGSMAFLNLLEQRTTA